MVSSGRTFWTGRVGRALGASALGGTSKSNPFRLIGDPIFKCGKKFSFLSK
jgi:hypothetical protein